MKNELISAIDEIISSLIESGKDETAQHFLSVKSKILTTKNNAKLKVVLKRLVNSGSITQYANFNHRQDHIFERICDAAEDIYNNIHASKLKEKIYDLID